MTDKYIDFSVYALTGWLLYVLYLTYIFLFVRPLVVCNYDDISCRVALTKLKPLPTQLIDLNHPDTNWFNLLPERIKSEGAAASGVPEDRLTHFTATVYSYALSFIVRPMMSGQIKTGQLVWLFSLFPFSLIQYNIYNS